MEIVKPGILIKELDVAHVGLEGIMWMMIRHTLQQHKQHIGLQ